MNLNSNDSFTIPVLIIILLILLYIDFPCNNEKFTGFFCGTCKGWSRCNYRKGYCTFLGL